MGIEGLFDVIKRECPEVIIKTHLSKLSGLRVAVDISIFLYQCVRSTNTTFLDGLITRICMLKRHNIDAIYVFDGEIIPEEKRIEQRHRRESEAKRLSKKEDVDKLLDIISERITRNEDISDNLSQIKVLLAKSKQSIDYEDINNVYGSLRNYSISLSKQTTPVTDEIIYTTKQLLNLLGLEYVLALGEGEKTCAGLCINKEVDAVLSEDTDVLAYGSPVMLSKLDVMNETVCIVCHEDVCNGLSLTPSSFVDLCIMLRCDYNRHNGSIKGYPPTESGKSRKKPINIGPIYSLSMIREYGSIDNMLDYIENISPLNHIRCRELFTVNDTMSFDTKVVGDFDIQGLDIFLTKNGTYMSSKDIGSIFGYI